MRILQRFIANGHHYGPGDEGYLARNASKAALGEPHADPALKAANDLVAFAAGLGKENVDPSGTPWTAIELAKLAAEDAKAARDAEKAAHEQEIVDRKKAHADKTEENRKSGQLVDTVDAPKAVAAQ